jgi:acylphosphatase
MTDCIRQHLIVEGTVQNVGFRYEMTRLARQLGITGWVMNRVDGSVEAIVQGSSSAIQLLLEELNACRPIHITALHKTPLPIVENETGFITRYV